jgi:hypothetical protein
VYFLLFVIFKIKAMAAIEKTVQFGENGNAILKSGKHFSKKDAKIVILIKDDDISENEWLSVAVKGSI